MSSSQRRLSRAGRPAPNPPRSSIRPYPIRDKYAEAWRAYSIFDVWQITHLYHPSRFHLLFNERKRATPHDGPQFPFLRLPPELRLQIYRHVLVQPAPIELWAHAKNNTMYGSTYHRRMRFDEYKDLIPVLGLLRVCSLIHSEASAVFYGENEFRFSAINGWMVLDAFLYTITPRHFQYLRHITVHVPFPGIESLANPTYHSLTFTERICRMRRQNDHMRRFLQRQGLRVPQYWNYDAAVSRTVKQLSTSSHLKTFQVVLPPTYYINHDSKEPAMSLGWYWRKLESLVYSVNATRGAQGYKPMHVGFIFLKLTDSYHRVSIRARELRPWLIRYRGQTKKMRDILKDMKWVDSVKYGVHDWVGTYQVMDWNECRKRAGPLAMQLDDMEEEDIDNWGTYDEY